MAIIGWQVHFVLASLSNYFGSWCTTMATFCWSWWRNLFVIVIIVIRLLMPYFILHWFLGCWDARSIVLCIDINQLGLQRKLHLQTFIFQAAVLKQLSFFLFTRFLQQINKAFIEILQFLIMANHFFNHIVIVVVDILYNIDFWSVSWNFLNQKL